MNKSVVTLGTFDGLHRGHQRIVRKVVERARRLGVQSVALAFGMPPKLGLRPSASPVLLTTLLDKIQMLKQLGIDRVQVLVFNRKTASTPAETFFENKILKQWGAREMVVGPRVAFGKNRLGRLPMLRVLGRRHSVKIHVVGGVKVQGSPVSSSRIRELLYRGEVETAGRQLGYPYFVGGKVVHGNHRGRVLGFPTANVEVDAHKILPPGVFWVKVLPSSGPIPLDKTDLRFGWDGLCNVGTRPTFTPKARTLICEVFLFKTPPQLYGKDLRVIFLRRIRSEKRFSSAAALQRQIAIDFETGQKWARAGLYNRRSIQYN